MLDKVKLSLRNKYSSLNRGTIEAVEGANKLIQESLNEVSKDHSTLINQVAQNNERITDIGRQLKDQINNKGAIYTGDNEIIVKIYNGLKIYLDLDDIGVAPHLALDGIWEENVTKAWTSLIKPRSVVFDIGANFGYYGLLAAHKMDKKQSKVIFMEANPHLIKYIQKTLNLNWYNEQSVVENVAVSDKTGTTSLNIIKDYIGSSTLQDIRKLRSYMDQKMKIEVQEKVKVKSITIDDYCAENNIHSIDLIKMDIEGYEDKAFEGMSQIIKNSPELTMFVEFTRESYQKPEKFFNDMLKVFSNLYLIAADGKFIKPKKTDYISVIGNNDDWVMLVLSKQELGHINGL